jgi:hypothetical protein
MSFGFGMSMPNLRKVGGGAAPPVVTPITLKLASVAALMDPDPLDSGINLTLPGAGLVAGDKVVFALSTSDGNGVATCQIAYQSTTADFVITSLGAVGSWNFYIANVTSTIPNEGGSLVITPSVSVTFYCFAAAWYVSNVNATPFEGSSNVATTPTVGSPQSFTVTTTNANDGVFGIAYPNLAVGTLSVFTPSTSGWTSTGPATANLMSWFFAVQNPDVGAAGAKTVSSTVTGSPDINVASVRIRVA